MWFVDTTNPTKATNASNTSGTGTFETHQNTAHQAPDICLHLELLHRIGDRLLEYSARLSIVTIDVMPSQCFA